MLSGDVDNMVVLSAVSPAVVIDEGVAATRSPATFSFIGVLYGVEYGPPPPPNALLPTA